ncbi:MAG: DUF305 domain-containing protein [Rhizobiales bacterium]|nr:DUF305 domain-containing protein [Hyphomicrobiales bacterium]
MKMKLITAVMALALAAPLLATTPARAQDAAMQANMDVHKKMMDGMAGMKMSGDADKDFAMMMIPHHQGAIDMAEIELKYGKDPALRKMAEDIISAQKKEIEEFKAWQQKHGM